jgi:hypothetical protein
MKTLKSLLIAIGFMVILLSFKASSENFINSSHDEIKQTPAKTKTSGGISNVAEIKISLFLISLL